MGGQSSKNSDSSRHNDSTQVSAEGPKRHHRDCDYQFKVLLLGDSGRLDLTCNPNNHRVVTEIIFLKLYAAVGKSNLLNRLVDDKFTRIYVSGNVYVHTETRM